MPTESDAYVIFETLNDRGADLTIADLLKNYLYGRAQDKLEAVKKDWALALGALELTAADGKFVAFLRHYWSSLDGVTRERELYAAIQSKVKTEDRGGQVRALDRAGHGQVRRVAERHTPGVGQARHVRSADVARWSASIWHRTVRC